MNRILPLALILALSGCTATGALNTAAGVADAAGAKPPTPCANTAIDEKALTLTSQSVDVAAQSIDVLAKANVPGFVKGTPSALKVAYALDDARKAVNVAQLARKACDAPSYMAALNNAEAAFATVKSLLKPGN